MDSITSESILYSLVTAILLLAIIVRVYNTRKIGNRRRLPPGPPAWPIIGNLPQLGDKPHQSLFDLAHKYGPLMSLQLGSKTTVVVSSPSMAREVLKDNAQSFSSRSINIAAKIFAYQGTSLVWSPYGPRWRLLRKICNNELFTAKRLDNLQHLRREVVFEMINSIFHDSRNGKSVAIGATAFLTALSLVGKMICGKNVFQSGSKEAVEFKEMVWEVLKLTGTPNLSDFFPFLQRFDLQGLNHKMTNLARRFDHIFEKIIEERLTGGGNMHSNDDEGKDLLQVLLDLRYDPGRQLTLEDIKGLQLDMFIAGTDSTSATVEWGMTELLRKPELMKRVQAELDEVVGQKSKMEESNIAELPYLQAVVKEVLRLHPPAPLIVPRRSDNSCEVGGFVVPENTQVFVNIWGIGRDPLVWKQPLDFIPDRFLECNIDYRGQDFELIPFGAGRRICIGLPLAHRMVHLMLGSLLHSFNWSIPESHKDGIVDMSELFGLSLLKAVPLIAVPTPRLPENLYC
eukprot:Gb_09401 [translate_table: standard]